MTTTTAPQIPDQPDGIDEYSYDLPDPRRAAERVREYIAAWGDGLMATADGHPLYARDLEAICRAVLDAARIVVEPPARPADVRRCPRCRSPRWLAVSLDGGWTRRAQCVPCGAYHLGSIGPGWKSPRADAIRAEQAEG